VSYTRPDANERYTRIAFPVWMAALLALWLSLPAAAQTVTVRVTVLEVKALTNFDGADDPDWYARVFIDGTEFINEDTPETDDVEGEKHIFVDWKFSKDVDLSQGFVPVSLEIRDEDGLFKLDDDLADINPTPGKHLLDMTVDLAPCSVAGDKGGPCRQNLVSFSNDEDDEADGRAEVRFKIEVLNVPGLHVRCTHTPIWPQPGESVTLTAQALDGNLNAKTVDTVLIAREGLPDDSASNASSHSVTFTPGGDSFVYGCRATDPANDKFTDWRRVSIGLPPMGRAIPVLVNPGMLNGVDLVLVPDQDNYSGPGDPLFLEHAANVIYDAQGGVYSERVHLEHQNQINVYLAMDRGDAEAYDPSVPTCPHVPPSNLATDYMFAETFAIVHTDDFRDCARGDGVFSSEPPALSVDSLSKRTFVHEFGHRPFGLGDEYCNTRPGAQTGTCDGGYVTGTTGTFPNIFMDPFSCAQDAANEGFGMITCDSWMDDRGGGPWHTYDPVTNDMMFDNGDGQFLDVRRIDFFYSTCATGGCI